MLEMFVLSVIFLLINLVLMVRRVPLVGVPISIFTLYMGVVVFLKDTTLPANPYYSLFILFIAVMNLLINAADFNMPTKGGR